MKTCVVSGCGAKFLARGYCNKHYKRVRINNSLDVTPKYQATHAPPEVRFWERVEKTETCWIWKGGRRGRPGNVYGRLEVNSRPVPAHRYAYELIVGPIPEGLTLDHLCRNTVCVNPAHLEPVTLGVNTLRGNTVSGLNARKTHCPRGHEYTLENTRKFRGKRHCRTCQKVYDRDYYQARKHKELEARKEQSNA